jgi:SAM-dependent methyltransferase
MAEVALADAAARFPVRIGRPEAFERVRGFLRAAGFDDDTVCRTLGVENLGQFARIHWDAPALAPAPALLRSLIEVFIRGRHVPEAEFRALCGEEAWGALLALGLLATDANPALIVSPVWLYPVDGFLVISDRHDDPHGRAVALADDAVFPAMDAGTLRFLKLLPDARGGAALDLCGGCGIGALHLSRTTRDTVTADLTERSAFFADFNSRLNGASIASVCGDLYEPLRGQTFDLIAAHPPFVPAETSKMVFRDAGETGEDIVRRIVDGLPAHLRANGTCMIVCAGRDAEKPFEQRARDWLGAAASRFDVVFGHQQAIPVEHIAGGDAKDTEGLPARIRAMGTHQYAYGALMFRRCAEPVTEAPLRIQLAPFAAAADLARVLLWRDHRRRTDFAQWLAGARPRLSPHLTLTARHALHEGRLVPNEFELRVAGAVPSALRLQGWMVPLLKRLDGSRTIAEALAAAQAAGEAPKGITREAFADLLNWLIERTFLDVEFP